jgi:Icc-related predicted phosphoesterase
MKFCILSDTHGSHWDIEIPKVDYLIHCGDATNTVHSKELFGLNNWVKQEKEKGSFKKMIFIPGNHDLSLERFPDAAKELLPNIDHILIHEGMELEGLKIWGCPYVPTYFNWAFMKDEDDLYWIYNQIPVNLDILVCHGPPRGHCDWNGKEHAGSYSMRDVLEYKQPKYYVCGHIHTGRGVSKLKNTTILNVANMDVNYNVLPPVILEV